MRLAEVILSTLAVSVLASDLSTLVERDPQKDPRDFSWIRKWAAVGDSFVSGIGAGSLWNKDKASKDCSRYDLSFAAQLSNFFPSVTDFHYLACAGANSGDIYKQIQTLPEKDLDLVVLMGGGNDLCLTSLVWSCIMSSQTTQSACDSIQATTQSYIDSSLRGNIDQLIDSAVTRLTTNGILVFPQYARFFNDEADAPCHFDEDWVFPGTAGGGSLLLTTTLRANLNKLIDNGNRVIAQAIFGAQLKYKDSPIKITTVTWDKWLDLVKGRFCEPSEKPDPDDPANKNAHFFKLDTTKRPPINSLLKTRFVDNSSVALESAETSNNFTVSLSERDPSPPACPKSVWSGFTKDWIGKIFHPTPLGHLTLASFVGDAISVARARIINAPNPDCQMQSDLTCWQKTGSKKYADPFSLYSSTDDFCKSLVANTPSNSEEWSYSKSYYDKLPDGADWHAEVKNGAIAITYDQCHSAVNQILDNCDGSDPNNPMNWKFGGKLESDNAVFTISPSKQNRVFPPYKEPIVLCDCWYHVFWDSFNVRGGGWAGWDYGKGGDDHGGGLLGNLTACTLTRPTRWKFDYYDEPDADGYEWHASATSIIWMKQHCLQPSIDVARGHKGKKAGCKGNG